MDGFMAEDALLWGCLLPEWWNRGILDCDLLSEQYGWEESTCRDEIVMPRQEEDEMQTAGEGKEGYRFVMYTGRTIPGGMDTEEKRGGGIFCFW